jgi:hypothetical protein
MNRQKISEMSWQQMRFWPPTRRFDSWGRELQPMNDIYLITEADRQHVTVRNTRTDHQFPINNDHIREFLSDSTGRTRGLFILKSQIILQYRGVWLEPLIG